MVAHRACPGALPPVARREKVRGDMLRVEIETDNAAFQNGQAAEEAARLLREAADRIADGATIGGLRDHNGNNVGQFMLLD
ncbi:hypothetical protein GCM10022379_19530 [Micromonospora maritima]